MLLEVAVTEECPIIPQYLFLQIPLPTSPEKSCILLVI